MVSALLCLGRPNYRAIPGDDPSDLVPCDRCEFRQYRRLCIVAWSHATIPGRPLVRSSDTVVRPSDVPGDEP